MPSIALLTSHFEGAPSSPTGRCCPAPFADCAHALEWAFRESNMTQDWAAIASDLERLLKLRSIVFAMKLFERREEMEAIERILRPKAVHTRDQIDGQPAPLGWTVAIT